MIYLDNNATTRVAPEVLAAMLPVLGDTYGNPSSKHSAGEQARLLLGGARRQVAEHLGVSPAEVIFTSGCTEANQMAVQAALQGPGAVRRVLVMQTDHGSTLALVARLQKQGVEVVRLPVNAHGRLDLAALAQALTAGAAVFSLAWVNNETGVVQDLDAIASLTRAAGVRLHVDAAQAIGRLPLDMRQLPADTLSLSAHKFHGPKGVGALIVRKGVSVDALIVGEQERRRRGGTENLSGIVGLARALQLAYEQPQALHDHLACLRDAFELGIVGSGTNVSINGDPLARAPHVTSLSFTGVDAEELLVRLDQAGVLASLGAACGAAGTEPSHVLLAMGLSPAEARSTVRFAVSRYTTAAQIADAVAIVLKVLQGMMPVACDEGTALASLAA